MVEKIAKRLVIVGLFALLAVAKTLPLWPAGGGVVLGINGDKEPENGVEGKSVKLRGRRNI